MERKKPHFEVLLEILNEHEVEYVVTGSAAAMLHGVVLEPVDLDITPALHHDNLDRLRHVLEAIHARQYENASFGHWEATAAGEQHACSEPEDWGSCQSRSVTPMAFGNAETDTPARSLATNVNGQVNTNNTTRTDGATNMNIWLPNHNMYISPAETVDTVNVSTSSFDAALLPWTFWNSSRLSPSKRASPPVRIGRASSLAAAKAVSALSGSQSAACS